MGEPQEGTKIRGYAISIHEIMTRDAKVQEDGSIVWEGSVAACFREVGASTGYHTPIMRMLQQTDCVRQLKQGSRHVKSAYLLMRSPGTIADDDWPSINSIVKSARRPLTTETPGYKLLEQQIKNLARRIPEGLDLATALVELSQQITVINLTLTELERRLDAIEKKN